ncbi:MAG: ASCH domain-containing protein [archaeon]
MLFQPEHIKMIKNGEKTVTRRDWDKRMIKAGNIYPCQTKMFQTKEECEVFIKVKKWYKENLGEMTEEDAKKEGGYSLKEFKQLWKNLNGSWDDNLEVFVIEFEVVEDYKP